jgi:hypothetical protein
MLSLHDQNRGPWILLHVALDKGRFNMTVCGRYRGELSLIFLTVLNIPRV